MTFKDEETRFCFPLLMKKHAMHADNMKACKNVAFGICYLLLSLILS